MKFLQNDENFFVDESAQAEITQELRNENSAHTEGRCDLLEEDT